MKCGKAVGMINATYIQIFCVHINAWGEVSNESVQQNR